MSLLSKVIDNDGMLKIKAEFNRLGDPFDYTVIFTSGATQAMKLVAESFNFGCDERENMECGSFVYLNDNHTSVLGLRELLKESKVNVVHISKHDFLQTLGALLVKNRNVDILNKKKYFGGGTVDVVLASEDYHVKRTQLHERFEDGTIPFLSIIALKHCFDVLSKMIPKQINNNVMDTISYHTFYLAKDLYEQLKSLHHKNGRPAAILYMDSGFEDIKTQAGIVTFNVVRADGTYIGYAEVNSSWEIGVKGFKYDREWMIVKDNGVCLTQKQNTHMCMIRPSFDFEENQLKLDFPGKKTVSLPLEIPVYGTSKHISLCQSKVCTDLVQGYDCGDEVGDWISDALGISFLRLIRQSDYTTRSKKSDTNDVKLSLSNQAQFLLINMATVQWLQNKIMDNTFVDSLEQLTDRFRANIIVDSDEELIEREWTMVMIGKHLFKVEGLCSRCQMVCIDQQTGLKTVEPLRTISEQFSGKMKFGIYLSYAGTIDNSNDVILKIKTPVTPMICDK
ncbi:Molybdenum cofactor sulfurase [Eumeta japonica]|uniref:Molybdenum cofactor sulfurase n=1 Tax=Eumeta variegata TaxID=151549 RepID=A0A4C1V8Q8_EUMVA|nr:Molybdenum cofactor sulfurase [Eumeta japonica]